MEAEEESVRKPLVFFDLETTGLDKKCEIVQLAAVSGDHTLNLYIVPRRQMQHGASRITGFHVRRQRLFQHRHPVLTNTLREVVVSFITFLRMLRHPLVVGHNIRRFDCPLLARALDELDLRAEFESCVSGCVDTLPLARELLKDRQLQSFTQENLVRELLGLDYRAHDALEDVRALQALYRVLQPTAEVICRHRFTLDTMNKPAAQELPISKHPTKLNPLDEFCKQTAKLK
ncbi:unnamed protein product [Ophioblennius macclurei]